MRTFGEPYYDSDNDEWKADIINVQDRDEDYHEQYEDDFQYEATASQLNERLAYKAIPFMWVVAKFYDFLYIGKDIEIHPNRVYSQLYNMISAVTWQDLIDMQIVTETEIFKNLDGLSK